MNSTVMIYKANRHRLNKCQQVGCVIRGLYADLIENIFNMLQVQTVTSVVIIVMIYSYFYLWE